MQLKCQRKVLARGRQHGGVDCAAGRGGGTSVLDLAEARVDVVIAGREQQQLLVAIDGVLVALP